jgi:S-adenosylmethionine synthetase
MAEKTALVTGATGLLGRQVVRAFDKKSWNVKGTGYSRADGVSIFKADLGSSDEVEKLLDNVKFVSLSLYTTHPLTVAGLKSSSTVGFPLTHTPRPTDIPGAAQRFPDKVDKDPEASKALNVTATRTLAGLCAARDILLIYISTDYVFSGKPGDAPYEADATPGPTNLYGQTKLDGELAVLDVYANAGTPSLGVALRVPVLYGKAETPAESATNVLMDTLWKAQEASAKVKMDHWSIRYPTNTEDVGRVCADIAARYLDAGDEKLPRVLQFSSEDRMTKYEICQTFADIMGLSMDNIEANTEGNDPAASVQRPFDCHLSTKALRDLGIDVSTNDFVGWWRREVNAFRH